MRILLVKLGALGDVLRTTPLLTALKDRHPKAHITWIVDAPHLGILQGNPLIDCLMDSSDRSLQVVKMERFNLAVNLDKEPEATRFLAAAKADIKKGFGEDASGALVAVDAASDYAYRLGVDDDLKFRKNKKSYQEISFEQLGLDFAKEDYIFSVPEDAASEMKAHLSKLGLRQMKKPFIGLNTGSGARFAGKRLPIETLVTLAEKITNELGGTVLLLGGEDEIARNAEIQKKAKVALLNTGSHSIPSFAAIVQACDAVVTGDTTAMHIAIAVKTPVVAIFGSTCAQEIEMYGRGRKIVSKLPCAPCYKKKCPMPIEEECMKEMKTEEIIEELKEVLTDAHRLS